MLEAVRYCPILHSRIAEIKALSQLSSETKDRIFPIIVWRPWPNATHLSRTTEKLVEGFAGRRFAVDLDEARSERDGTPAEAEFRRLFDPADGHLNYYSFVGGIPNAVPVLRGAPIQLSQQLEHVARLGRGLVIRLQYGVASEFVDAAKAALAISHPDVVAFVDAGWSTDLLGRELWASSIIGSLSNEFPDVEMVVSGSSFPESFANIHGRGARPILERRLHTELVRRHNAPTLVYGDWGSTRPPAIESTPMKNVRRIDLPSQAEWLFWRQEDDETYVDLAERLVNDAIWPSELVIWGTYLIRCTSEGLTEAIRSPGTAAAVRINIHLHRQAYVGEAVVPGDPEEPYVDV